MLTIQVEPPIGQRGQNRWAIIVMILLGLLTAAIHTSSASSEIWSERNRSMERGDAINRASAPSRMSAGWAVPSLNR